MRPAAEQILLIVVAVISIVVIACSDRLPESVQADAETEHPAESTRYSYNPGTAVAGVIGMTTGLPAGSNHDEFVV